MSTGGSACHLSQTAALEKRETNSKLAKNNRWSLCQAQYIYYDSKLMLVFSY